jgi:hypothetical protein
MILPLYAGCLCGEEYIITIETGFNHQKYIQRFVKTGLMCAAAAIPSPCKHRYQQPGGIVRQNVQIHEITHIPVDPYDLCVRELPRIWHQQ